MAKRRNKGQAEHAFAFILFILIAGVVMLLGYKAISGLFGDSCDLQKSAFTEKIIGMFQKYDDFGAVNLETLQLPCGYSGICFVDSSVYNSGQQFTPSQLDDTNMLEVLATASDTKVNIFLIGEFADPIGYSEKISLNSTLDLCVKARGTMVNLVFKGQGRETLVMEG